MSQKVGGLSILGMLGAVVIAGVIVAPLVGFGNSANADSSNSSAHTVAFDPGTDLVPADAKCVSNDYINSSTQVVKTGDAKYRQFATAISIPYAGTTDAAVSTETSKEICGNPTELKMVADDMMLWTGFPGADSNKVWLKKVVADLNTSGLDSFIAKKTQDGGLIVSEKFQKYAGWINSVLLRFNTNGEQSLASVRNWEQPATVDPTTQPVAVQATDQESKPAWVRTLVDKNGKCLYKIGFNAEDKRIETFNCVTPKPPTTTTTPKSGCTTNCGTTTPKCTTDCGGTGGCKTNCGTTPGCKTNCSPACTVTCLTPKNPKNDVNPPTGTTPLGPDKLQPTAPAPKTDPLKPTTPVTTNPGTTAPGATPASPSSPAAPSIPVTQQPAPSSPGTPITDPDG